MWQFCVCIYNMHAWIVTVTILILMYLYYWNFYSPKLGSVVMSCAQCFWLESKLSQLQTVVSLGYKGSQGWTSLSLSLCVLYVCVHGGGGWESRSTDGQGGFEGLQTVGVGGGGIFMEKWGTPMVKWLLDDFDHLAILGKSHILIFLCLKCLLWCIAQTIHCEPQLTQLK